MSAYKFPFVGRPFKGHTYYECQIGPFVLQYRHTPGEFNGGPISRPVHIGHAQAWVDRAWAHELRFVRRVRRFIRNRSNG